MCACVCVCYWENMKEGLSMHGHERGRLSGGQSISNTTTATKKKKKDFISLFAKGRCTAWLADWVNVKVFGRWWITWLAACCWTHVWAAVWCSCSLWPGELVIWSPGWVAGFAHLLFLRGQSHRIHTVEHTFNLLSPLLRSCEYISSPGRFC